jgi:hypothetical protein
MTMTMTRNILSIALLCLAALAPGAEAQALVGDKTMVSTATSALTATTMTVSFETALEIDDGGSIEIVLPACTSTTCWDAVAAPAVTLTGQGATTVAGGVGAWTGGTRTLVVTLGGAALAAASAITVAFPVTTPSGAQAAAADAVVSTKNAAAADLDTATDFTVSATVAGTPATLSFGIAGNTNPGVNSVATASVTLATPIEQGGLLTLTFPALATTTKFEFDNIAPAIVITNPAGITATGAWVTANRILTITTTGGGTLAAGQAVTFTMAGCVNPSGVVVADTVLIGTTDAGGAVKDTATTTATPAISAGALSTLTFTAAAAFTPSTAQTTTVSFVVTSAIPASDIVEITFPDVGSTAKWENPGGAGLVIAVSAPGGGSATSAWDTANRKLTVTNGVLVPAGGTFTFTIATVVAPSGIQTSDTVSIATFDASGAVKDAAATATVAAVTSVNVVPTFALQPAESVPGVAAVSTASFTTAGRIAIGGKIQIVLPTVATVTAGWGFVTTTPAIGFTAPAGSVTAAGGNGAWDAANRALTITTATAAVPAGGTVTFTIADTLTPSGITGLSTVAITTYDGGDNVADGGDTGVLAAITVGALTTLSFATATDSPQFKQISTASFVASGQVPQGGKVSIVMPATAGRQSGWAFDNAPAIVFTAPGTATGTAAWETTADSRTLVVTTDGGGTIAAGATVTFTIANTVTPSATIDADAAAVSTFDAASVAIDGPTDADTEAITAGVLTALAFATTTDTPAVSQTATASFTTKGGIQVGGKIDIIMPAAAAVTTGWDSLRTTPRPSRSRRPPVSPAPVHGWGLTAPLRSRSRARTRLTRPPPLRSPSPKPSPRVAKLLPARPW